MTHTMIGPRIVKAVANENVLDIIKYNHARYDGPDKTSVGARIVTSADAFDAMTSDRPYRKGHSLGDALQEVSKCSGTQFDPAVPDVLPGIPTSELLSIVGSKADHMRDNTVISKGVPETTMAQTNAASSGIAPCGCKWERDVHKEDCAL